MYTPHSFPLAHTCTLYAHLVFHASYDLHIHSTYEPSLPTHFARAALYIICILHLARVVSLPPSLTYSPFAISMFSYFKRGLGKSITSDLASSVR